MRGIVAISGLLLLLTGLGTAAVAQEDDPETPGDTTAQAEPAQPQEPEQVPEQPQQPQEKEKKHPFGLYVEVAAGSADAEDLNNSTRTLSTHSTTSTFSLEGQSFGRVAIGWKLPQDRGQFRLTWTSYKEKGYTLEAYGKLSAVDPSLGVTATIADNLPWWVIDAEDGTLHTTQVLPQWSSADDTLDLPDLGILPGNQTVDCPMPTPLSAGSGGLLTAPLCEATFLVDHSATRSLASDMENRTQTVDLTYGRSFGTRRFSSRWTAGARYFVYDGTVPTPTWLTPNTNGTGFSDGFAFAMVPFRQENTALGPVVSMSFDVNFFERRLVLYIEGQAALVLYDQNVSTQQFLTLLQSTGSQPYRLTQSSELDENRSKTSWQNAIEAGVMINLKSGLQFHAAYNYTGFLDAVLLPTEIAIPSSPASTQGVSAIYGTQDYRLSSLRFGVAFQF